MSIKVEKNLPTSKDFEDIFSTFISERERIKFISKSYKDVSITKAFNIFYDQNMTNENKTSDTVIDIELGKCYWGTVLEISKSGISFSLPGVKEQIVSKENFSDCMDFVQVYLANHNNSLRFEVREKRHGTYYVSVISGYYNLWDEYIKRCIKKMTPIDIHIDSLTKGGYLCHTTINPLKELTGKEYTSSVFVPGSNIVLNIERDFDKWVGQDVQIVPQKFVVFKQIKNMTERSLIGSRKLLLQQYGNQNLFEIYNEAMTVQKLSSVMTTNYNIPTFEGTVTGIINSNNKKGVFIELNDKFITGLVPIDPYELLNYKPGDQVTVRIKEFEVQDGKEPFVLDKHNKVMYCNVRCVFELA